MTLTQEVYPFGELNFTIEYTYSPFTPGQYSGPPDRCYPDEPEELDISSIKVEDCPRISREFVEKERRRMDDNYFRQEFQCEFHASDTQYFAPDDIYGVLVDEPVVELEVFKKYRK